MIIFVHTSRQGHYNVNHFIVMTFLIPVTINQIITNPDHHHHHHLFLQYIVNVTIGRKINQEIKSSSNMEEVSMD